MFVRKRTRVASRSGIDLDMFTPHAHCEYRRVKTTLSGNRRRTFGNAEFGGVGGQSRDIRLHGHFAGLMGTVPTFFCARRLYGLAQR
jgi:hypothetical protein